MVEMRKSELRRCTCKDRVPFKLIRSVAVQVQTAKCRGGDLCPGSGVGLDPDFKEGETTQPKNNLTKKPDEQNHHTPSNSLSNAVSIIYLLFFIQLCSYCIFAFQRFDVPFNITYYSLGLINFKNYPFMIELVSTALLVSHSIGYKYLSSCLSHQYLFIVKLSVFSS